jgi:hypothetical protein
VRIGGGKYACGVPAFYLFLYMPDFQGDTKHQMSFSATFVIPGICRAGFF